MKKQSRSTARSIFGNLNYRYRVLLTILSVAVVPILVAGILLYRTSVKSVTQNLRQTGQARMEQAVQELEDKMQIYEHMTDYLISNQEVRRVLMIDSDQTYERYLGYTETVDPLLEMNMYYHHDIRRMTFYLNDVDLEHGTTVAPMEMLEKEIWYQRAFPGGDSRESWIISAENREVYYIRPIAMYTRMQAVLVIVFSYDGFLAPLSSLIQESTHLDLISDQGDVLFSDRAERIGTAQTSGGEWSSGIALSRPVNGQGWELRYQLSSRLMYGELNHTIWITMIVFLVCVVYVLLASWAATEALSRRIVALTDLVSRIGEKGTEEEEGNFERLEKYDGPMDEVGILAGNVRQMILRLRELRMEVYHEKIARRELEMKALQAQINPHFLYNSLSIINWMALDAGADDVSDVTLKLAEFYRTTLNRGASMILVDGEIRNIRSYLSIQLIMHDHSFAVEWDLDDSVRDWLMPKLVLQPLVENALEHGLDLKTEGEKKLYIKIGRKEEELVLIVRDNGVGMSKEKAESVIYYDSKGYGVKNVKERIRLLYGEQHIFKISSEEGKGTEIYIRFPGNRGMENREAL